jgi:hypothetical protein
MSDLWERFKGWWNAPSTDPFDVYESTREARHKELRAARIKQAQAELRDRFAGYALIGLLQAGGDLVDCGRDEIASEAWRQADAMMKARGHE